MRWLLIVLSVLSVAPMAIATTVEQGTPPWKASVTNSVGTIPATVTGSNALKVDSSAVTSPINQVQVTGAAVSTGNGVADAGTQRLTISSDNAPLTVTSSPATQPATYMAGTPTYTPPALPTDTICIIGSATKVVKIRRIEYLATQTTASLEPITLIKRSTASSGGTTVNVPIVPVDSANAAATATVVYYTANPTTPGFGVGNVYNLRQQVPAGAGAVQPLWKLFYEAPVNGQPITLRGVNESLCVNYAGIVLPTGLSHSLNVIFTEESP